MRHAHVRTLFDHYYPEGVWVLSLSQSKLSVCLSVCDSDLRHLRYTSTSRAASLEAVALHARRVRRASRVPLVQSSQFAQRVDRAKNMLGSVVVGLLLLEQARVADAQLHHVHGKTHHSSMDKAPITSTIRSEKESGTATGVASGVGSVREELFQHLVQYVSNAGLRGDYVETGVHNGASAVAVGRAMQCLNMTESGRRLWLYDSWEGFPQTTAQADGVWATRSVAGGANGTNWGAPKGPRPATMENVQQGLRNVGVDLERAVVFRKGWFDKTFAMEKPERVAFLHVDGDLYRSVKDTLVNFYDLVVPGGVILFDDYGYFEGCRTAFYEFLVEERREYPLLERHGNTQAWFIKGKEHNRGRASIAYTRRLDACDGHS